MPSKMLHPVPRLSIIIIGATSEFWWCQETKVKKYLIQRLVYPSSSKVPLSNFGGAKRQKISWQSASSLSPNTTSVATTELHPPPHSPWRLRPLPYYPCQDDHVLNFLAILPAPRPCVKLILLLDSYAFRVVKWPSETLYLQLHRNKKLNESENNTALCGQSDLKSSPNAFKAAK